MKKVVLTILLITASVFAVTAGGAQESQSENTKIVFSTGLPDQAWKNALETMISNANANLDGIEIVTEYYPSEEEMWKMLPAQIVAGTAPDLIGLNNEGVLELIVNGTLSPLDELVEKSGFPLSALDASNVNGWRYQEQLYSLPYTTTVSGLAVNMTMLEEAGISTPPSTMEELLEAAIAVTDPENDTYGVCINLHEYHITQYVHAMGGGWNFGDNLLNKNNEEGLSFIVDLFNKYKVAATPAQMGFKGDTDAFASGKFAMTTAGPWYIPTLREMDVDFDWVVVPIPEGNVQKSTVYGWGICMLDSCDDKEAAMQAVKAMLSDESYKYLAEVRGDIPAMTKYVATYETLYPEMAKVLNTAPDGNGFDYPAAANRFKSDLVTGMESIIFQRGNETVNSLLQSMAADGYSK